MKPLFILFFILSGIAMTYGQDKYNYVHFNKLTEVEGSGYVIATIEHRGKIAEKKEMFMLFINTTNGETRQVDFPKDAYIHEMKQIKIDSLGINLIVLLTRTVNLNGKMGIDWSDPMQVIVLSTDGKERKQLTDDKFFVRNWTVNKKTGKIVITGHHDSNNNNRYDKADKNEISIFDLKTLALVKKI